VTASVEVHSTRGDPRLENIVIRTKDKKGISASLKGSIAKFPLDADKPNTGYALDTVIKATQTSLIAERVGLDLPLKGPLDLAFRIEGDTEAGCRPAGMTRPLLAQRGVWIFVTGTRKIR